MSMNPVLFLLVVITAWMGSGGLAWLYFCAVRATLKAKYHPLLKSMLQGPIALIFLYRRERQIKRVLAAFEKIFGSGPINTNDFKH